jgi:hypothetical protein
MGKADGVEIKNHVNILSLDLVTLFKRISGKKLILIEDSMLAKLLGLKCGLMQHTVVLKFLLLRYLFEVPGIGNDILQ